MQNFGRKEQPWLGVTLGNQRDAIPYTCGHCGRDVASTIYGIQAVETNHDSTSVWMIIVCHFCHRPTVLDPGRCKQYPQKLPGRHISFLPEEIESLYSEACSCFSVSAYTAAAMCFRKILMNVAVHHGASEGEDFKEYVNYINSKHLVPPTCKFLIEKVREEGNTANHEIRSFTKEEAEDLLEIISLLLKTTYELPGKYRGEGKSEAVG